MQLLTRIYIELLAYIDLSGMDDGSDRTAVPACLFLRLWASLLRIYMVKYFCLQH